MATPTYIPLATTTLGSSASSVTFGSIPQDYRDLILVFDVTLDRTDEGPTIVLNSDTGANYSRVQMRGSGSVAASFSATGESGMFLYSSGFNKFWGSLQLMDYSATDKHKTGLTRSNNTGEYVVALAHRYGIASYGITTLTVEAGAAVYQTGSTFSLYGIAS